MMMTKYVVEKFKLVVQQRKIPIDTTSISRLLVVGVLGRWWR